MVQFCRKVFLPYKVLKGLLLSKTWFESVERPLFTVESLYHYTALVEYRIAYLAEMSFFSAFTCPFFPTKHFAVRSSGGWPGRMTKKVNGVAVKRRGGGGVKRRGGGGGWRC